MLTTVVEFQRQGASTDVNGDILPGAWGAITGSPTRAHVKAASGFERAQADRTGGGVMIKVSARYFAGLVDSDAVMIRGERHNVTFIDNVEFADKWMIVLVSGGVAV